MARELARCWDVLPESVELLRGQSGRLSPGYSSKPPLPLEVVAFLTLAELAPI